MVVIIDIDIQCFKLYILSTIVKVGLSGAPFGGDTIWGGLDWSPEEGYKCFAKKAKNNETETMGQNGKGCLDNRKHVYYGKMISFGKDVAEAQPTEIERMDFKMVVSEIDADCGIASIGEGRSTESGDTRIVQINSNGRSGVAEDEEERGAVVTSSMAEAAIGKRRRQRRLLATKAEEEVRVGDLRSKAAGSRVWLWIDEQLRLNDGAVASAATGGGGGEAADSGVEKSQGKRSLFLHHHRDIYRAERERVGGGGVDDDGSDSSVEEKEKERERDADCVRISLAPQCKEHPFQKSSNHNLKRKIS
ncbi:hypothetical protein HYC85_017715 [Camellia sinensis]|uniref:Uncharacterized protein n=1 Tax=Camellia sinensis TaxID=4442 RepID=A0A7J7GW31_CAMSI|nr:hypothetical protein HYC85_017715 [Camellia sinensis]